MIVGDPTTWKDVAEFAIMALVFIVFLILCG